MSECELKEHHEDRVRLKALFDGAEGELSEDCQARLAALVDRYFPGGGESLSGLVEPGDLLGKYRVDRVLGLGGQAVVYLGHHLHLGTQVALKLPLGEHALRMVREARVLASLSHRNILGIIDLELDEPHPHLVLEYCAGGSLADRLERKGRLPEDEVIDIGLALLDALEAAHAEGVVHRDLKPANVLFDGDGAVKLADFGIGKVVAEQLSLSLTEGQATAFAGTPVYLAPEQERPGRSVDGRTDLYALGKLLYFMLTGQPPRSIKPVEREREGLRGGWTELIFKLLETDPDKRFQTAVEARRALAALRSLTGPRLVSARRSESAHRPPPETPWLRRTCFYLGFAGLAALAVTLFLPEEPRWARALVGIGGGMLLLFGWSALLFDRLVAGFLSFRELAIWGSQLLALGGLAALQPGFLFWDGNERGAEAIVVSLAALALARVLCWLIPPATARLGCLRRWLKFTVLWAILVVTVFAVHLGGDWLVSLDGYLRYVRMVPEPLLAGFVVLLLFDLAAVLRTARGWRRVVGTAAVLALIGATLTLAFHPRSPLPEKPGLTHALGHSNPRVRHWAAVYLRGAEPSQERIQALTQAVNDEDEAVRFQAALALSWMAPADDASQVFEEAGLVLARQYRRDRFNAQRALERLGPAARPGWEYLWEHGSRYDRYRARAPLGIK